MNSSPKIEGVHFFIAGAARSGISAAKVLKKYGGHVFVTEENNILKEIEEELVSNNIPFEYGGHTISKISSECDVLVVSPGIPLNKEVILTCKNNKIPVVSEIEIAAWFMKPHDICLAVTGTNGKSTTVNYLSQLFESSNFIAKACGNIGTSITQTLLSSPDTNLFCIELSSYQLETTYSLRPMCTVLLNLQNDHLARYETIEEYLKAKWRLILLTHENGIAFIDKSVIKIALKIGLSLPQTRIVVVNAEEKAEEKENIDIKKEFNFFNFLSLGKSLPCSIYQELNSLNIENLIPEAQFEFAYAKYNKKNGSIHVFLDLKEDKKEWFIKSPCLPGEHNMINILCASIMANHIGVPDSHIISQWEEESTKYIHLAHRLEKVANKEQTYIDNKSKEKKLLIVNDSKATNIESTLVALKSFQKPIKLLLGGEPKGDSYLPLKDFFNNELNKLYPFGQAAAIIQKELKEYNSQISTSSVNMLSAANLAIDEAQDNEIILLSPGCSSFDEFKNFEHRGNVFREWATSHLKENKK